MNKRQLIAISHNYTKLKHKRQLEFLEATNRLEDYSKSKYKTPTTYIRHNDLNLDYYDYCKKNNLKAY
jgi:hypothetical protein